MNPLQTLLLAAELHESDSSVSLPRLSSIEKLSPKVKKKNFKFVYYPSYKRFFWICVDDAVEHQIFKRGDVREIYEIANASALKWQKLTDCPSASNIEIPSVQLANKLDENLELSQDDWDMYGIEHLTINHYIKSNDGKRYFKPQENGRLTLRLYRFTCVNKNKRNKGTMMCKNCIERKKTHLACIQAKEMWVMWSTR